MTLSPGARLGPYTIQTPLGAGGMGEVYRARDTRLNRDVAIKVLPEHLTGDADRRARLEREAQAVAALSHPNVVSIFDIGTHEGRVYVVTELLEGDTLRTRLSSGPLPLRKAIETAVEIARGLAAAHDRQLVHRDLKPENIFLVADGRVKILDFGLARRSSAADAAAETMAAAATKPGTVVGTVGYMAPEQVREQPIDGRADLFAFGAVLYEMLTGQRAFRHETAAETMTAILHEDPPELVRARTDMPPALERIVRHCLEKNPSERFQSARDIAFALEALSGWDSTSAHVPVTGLAAGRSWRGLIWFVAGFVVIGLAIVVAWIASSPAERGEDTGVEPPIALGAATQVTTEEGLEIDPALSPDGKFLAYAAGRATRMRVFIRAVSGGRPIPLSEGTDPLEFQPRWSPDGGEILFLSGGAALVAPALGGASRTVASNGITTAAWAPDGKRILVGRNERLSVAAIDGGVEQPLGSAVEQVHSCQWSARSSWIACALGNRQAIVPGPTFGNIAPSAIVLIPSTGGAPVNTIDAAGLNDSPAWSTDGRELYFISNKHGPRDIYVVAIGADGRAAGDPRRVTTGLGALSIALSAAGDHLAYVTYAARANIWSLPIPTGAPVGTSAARQITSGNQVVEAMRLSRDGKWLLYDSTLHGNADIFRLPIGGGSSERLTSDPADDFAPDLSPDGRSLLYHSWRSGTRDIFVQSLGGGPLETVTSSPSSESNPAWSPDGTAIAYFDQFLETGVPRGLFLVRRGPSGALEAPVQLQRGMGISLWLDPRSLVGHRNGAIEIVSVESRSSRVMYRPRPGTDDPGVSRVAPSEDGRTIYFKSYDPQGRASMWSIPVTGGTPRLLIRFNDPSRSSNRPDFAVGAGQIFFTLDDRQADIVVAEVTRAGRR